mgnify:CR=1 FL=1
MPPLIPIHTKLKIYSWIKYLINFIFCIIMPFLAVTFRTKSWKINFLSIFLTLSGWIPGVIHALIFTHRNKENVYPPIVYNTLVLSTFIMFGIATILILYDLTLITFIKIGVGHIRALFIWLCIGSSLMFLGSLAADGSSKDGRTTTGYSGNILPSTEFGFLLYGCIFWVAQWFLGKFSILPDWAPTLWGLSKFIF